ncbi:MAG: HD domain-containing phosphohydrolase [Acidobacteriota bacterium]
MIRIAILDGGGELRSYLLDKQVVRIGRSEANDIVLRNGYISSRHAEIRRDSSAGLLLEDFVTTNGSMIRRDGELLPLEDKNDYTLRVSDGDELLLGDPAQPVCLKAELVGRVESSPESEGPALDLSEDAMDVTRAGTVDQLSARFDRDALLALHELSSRLVAVLDLDTLLGAFADSVLGLFRTANHVAIHLHDAESREYRPMVVRTRHGSDELQPLSRAVRDRVLTRGEALCFSDADADFSMSESLVDCSIRAGLCAPLWNGEELMGMVQVDRRGTLTGAFTRRDLEVLVVFAHQAALAIGNARLHDNLRSTVETTIRGLVRALEAKDEYTSGHSEAVRDISRVIAREMGLTEAQVRDVGRAALLHDIGKIGIPYDVLNKKGRLEPEEFQLLKSHVEVGARILDPFDFLAPLLPMVRHHHERWDGRGYPDGLKGTAIPLGARILAVADTYHALVSHRAYRDGVGTATALDEIRRHAGTQFDQQVVDVLVRALDREDVAAQLAPTTG